MSLPRVLALSALLLTGAFGAALAQDARPGVEPAGPTRWDPAAMRQRYEAHRAERAKALHDILAIQPSQEAAFSAFMTAMRPTDRFRDRRPDGDARRGPGDDAQREMSMTTPERLDRMKARMDERLAAMRERFDRRAQATKALYAALDPRQRAAMDALPELGGHGRDFGHMAHEGSHGGMGPGM